MKHFDLETWSLPSQSNGTIVIVIPHRAVAMPSRTRDLPSPVFWIRYVTPILGKNTEKILHQFDSPFEVGCPIHLGVSFWWPFASNCWVGLRWSPVSVTFLVNVGNKVGAYIRGRPLHVFPEYSSQTRWAAAGAAFACPSAINLDRGHRLVGNHTTHYDLWYWSW